MTVSYMCPPQDQRGRSGKAVGSGNEEMSSVPAGDWPPCRERQIRLQGKSEISLIATIKKKHHLPSLITTLS